MKKMIQTALIATALMSSAACQSVTPNPADNAKVSAREFVKKANQELSEAAENASHAAWLSSTYINIDSQMVSAKAFQEYNLLSVQYAKKAATYDESQQEADVARQLKRLKLDLVLPAPDDRQEAKKLASIGLKMEAMYGSGEYCNDERCYSLEDMVKIFAESRDSKLLKELWEGWRNVSPPMRPLYQKQVNIANAGAQDLGFANLSELWRSNYDMAPDAFAQDVDAQWGKVKPLYEALQCHVRSELNQHYGNDVAPQSGKIPAHLLGNMWAQTWGNVYELVKPENSEQSYDLTELIAEAGMTEMDMVKTGEAFFSSLGFEPLPDTFWERSQFIKPRDREVVCHASAWNVDNVDDLRIKMCIKKDAEDFQVVHHELGHNYYQRAYNQQPFILRGAANDGFHEAIGDTVALSITPSYLVQLGLLEEEPPVEEDLGYLMNMALNKIAFLPFGLLVDKWRWQVFSGEIAPEDYNKGWWKLREDYQGVSAPVDRSERNFDPGAKYHIPGNTPYTRYFLAFIQQFQFHRALCDEIGYEGPLHRCSIYNNTNAGEKLQTMMAMGTSQPWPDAMEALTGQRELDASAIIDYFAPLMSWLEEQNKDRQCGW
ncbi:MAG: peptidyl-dipeptidase [Cellvibrionaceae bacterium]|nr:peptidyl-dipeptidase [Cellvibrionaceae bacterium]|tara:strand:+ start:57081 stop:58889 length:1809 start_codon:yes stop_codon:yes gene_type:complete